MLFLLFSNLADEVSPFNVFRYQTSRTGLAIITALIFVFLFGPRIISLLKVKQGRGQPIRTDGPQRHIVEKQGTPTMGGLLILFAVVISVLLWADLSNRYVWATLGVTVSYGIIGFLDDYRKVSRRDSRGISGRFKLVLQTVIAVAAVIWVMDVLPDGLRTTLAVPFFKNVLLDLGGFFVIVAAFVMVGASNAVNLTDGLDGLAIVPVMIAAAVFAVISYLVGNTLFANYLQVHYVPGTGELAVVCGALIGASLGFLWFNAPPAAVFMGDTGSLSLGGALGAISVSTKHELVLAIVGGLFVLETVSVIVQVASFKLTGKRVFRMAPLHHHFEKKGWAESTVVIRFWIIAMILGLAGLATLKLR